MDMEIKHRIDLIKLLPEFPVTVELGVAEGNFSRDICKYWKPKKHYAVDLWEIMPHLPGDVSSPQEWHNKNYNNAMMLLAPYVNIVEILRGPTTRMAAYAQDVDLVYVDACHAYDCVRADITAWWPKIKPGGIMAFHDYLNPDYGVTQAVQEIGLEIHLIPENRPEDRGAWIWKPI